MSLVVMKFGGSSVGNAERIKHVAEIIKNKKAAGHQCVVVVSAMGDTTDELIDLSEQINPAPPAREMDMLLTTGEQISMSLLTMALAAIGEEAISFTGWQSGFRTDGAHGKAQIKALRPKRVLEAIEQDKIVVIAGFQGLSDDEEITTLGRGGSDTTAVAIAAAIEAEVCEIYSDVDGIYSTDPRMVKLARKHDEISYDEMLELAHLGAAVLHPRAVEYAKHHHVQLIVRSSFTDSQGTVVKEESSMEQGVVVRGIAFDKDVARISIHGVEDIPGILATVFTALADAEINVDVIVQSGIINGSANFSFTVHLADEERAIEVIEQLRDQITFRTVSSETGLVKVSIVGAGMISHPGVAAQMFEIIARQGVSIKMVSTSDIKISCVIDSTRLTEVILALHTEFGLDATQQASVGGPQERR